MLSKFISKLNKIELQNVEKEGDRQGDEKARMYISSVFDILTEDTLEITMPVENNKLILLPVDNEYDMVIYGKDSLYQCFARIIDRYKSDNVYLLVVELTSNLRKYQRREYYRFSCALEMYSRNLEETEVQTLEQNMPYALTPGLPLKQSVIVDISGGGLRFISSQRYEPDSLLYCSYHLLLKDSNARKKFEVVGKVLSVKELENRSGVFEHRVQYYDIDQETREEIIKYIFEEERRNRRKAKFGSVPPENEI